MPGFATERSAKWNATGGSFRLRVRLTENLLGDPSPVNDIVIKNASRFTRYIEAHAPPSEVEAALNETLLYDVNINVTCVGARQRDENKTLLPGQPDDLPRVSVGCRAAPITTSGRQRLLDLRGRRITKKV